MQSYLTNVGYAIEVFLEITRLVLGTFSLVRSLTHAHSAS